MPDEPHIRELSADELPRMLPLIETLNPAVSPQVLRQRLAEMLASHYRVFGLELDGQLVGLCGAWLTTRLYSGRQVELDNVIIQAELRGRGLGTALVEHVEGWARQQGCESVELNTYVTNPLSHKFYFQAGYTILGYHFQKPLHDS